MSRSATRQSLRAQADKLRLQWAADDAKYHGAKLVDGDYAPDSMQWKLQTGEALRQVGEMQKQTRDIVAKLPKDIPNVAAVAEEIRNEIHNLNVKDQKDYFANADVMQSAVDRRVLDFEKAKLRAQFKNKVGEGTSEEAVKKAWYEVFSGLGDELLKKRTELLRQYWAKKENGAADYEPGSETFKAQTGEALRQLVEGKVMMKIGSDGELEVTQIAKAPEPPPTRPAAARHRAPRSAEV